MIRNSKIVQKFEEELIKKEKVNLIKNFQIMDAIYTKLKISKGKNSLSFFSPFNFFKKILLEK
jgi:hypothetical protein